MNQLNTRRAREAASSRLALLRQQSWERRETDFYRRKILASIRFAMGDQSKDIQDNYRICAPERYYETAMRYRSAGLNLQWVYQYLDQLDVDELRHWVEVRYELVDHMESELDMVGVSPKNPYYEPYHGLKLENAGLSFMFDQRVVQTLSEHPMNWHLDLKEALIYYPEVWNRLPSSTVESLTPYLGEIVQGPSKDLWQAAKTRKRIKFDPMVEEAVQKDHDRITTAVLKQHDKIFGTSLVPRKSFCESVASFFKTFFTFKYHEQRNE